VLIVLVVNIETGLAHFLVLAVVTHPLDAREDEWAVD